VLLFCKYNNGFHHKLLIGPTEYVLNFVLQQFAHQGHQLQGYREHQERQGDQQGLGDLHSIAQHSTARHGTARQGTAFSGIVT